MILTRLVFTVTAGWILLTALGLGGLVWLVSSVEAVARGADDALVRGLQDTPAVLVLGSPLVALLGAALSAAWMDTRGERTAMAALGVGPGRTGRVVLLLGGLVGLLQLVLSDHILHRLTDEDAVEWVWLERGVAYRPADQLVVTGQRGRIEAVSHLAEPPAEVSLATQQQTPATASGRALTRASSVPLHLEWHVRRARVAACALLAIVGWLPLARTAERQVLSALGLGLAYLAVDTMLQASAAWGHLSGAAGAWTGIAFLALVAAGLLVRLR